MRNSCRHILNQDSELSMNINKSLKRGLFWNSFASLSNYGLQFLAIIVLARLLGPEEYGLIGIMGIFIYVAEIIIDSGMGGAVTKKINAAAVDYSTLAVFNITSSLILYAVYFSIAPLLSDIYGKPQLTFYLRIYALDLLINAFTLVPRITLQKQLRFKAYSLMIVVSNVVGLSVAVMMAYMGWGVMCLIMQYLSLSVVKGLIAVGITQYKLSLKFSKESFKEQFTFGINTTIANICKTFSENLYTNVIAQYTSIVQAGYYNQALKVSNVPNRFINSLLNSTIFPIFSQIGDHEEFSRKIEKINVTGSYFAFVGIGVLICFAEEIIQVLLGEKWLPTEWSMKMLLWTTAFIVIANIWRNLLKCAGKTFKILKNEVVVSLISVTLMFCAIPFGYEAIVYCFLFTSIVKTLLFTYIANKEIGMNFIRQIMVYLFAAVNVWVAVWACSFVDMGTWVMQIPLKLILYTVICNPLLIMLMRNYRKTKKTLTGGVKHAIAWPYHKIRRFIFYLKRVRYIKRLPKLIDDNVTIVCSNCFGGRLYQDRKLAYTSPFAGLFFFAEDYVCFLEHFDNYIHRKLHFITIDECKWKIARQKFPNRPHPYPIAQIEGTDIEIHFLHYTSRTDAEDKWHRRINRMNTQKILFIGMEQNNPSIEAKRRFAALPYNNKLYFCVHSDYVHPSMIVMKEFEKASMNECPNPYIYAHIYYKYLLIHLENNSIK